MPSFPQPLSIRRSLAAGFIATVALSLVMVVEQAIDLMPQMNIIAMLARIVGTKTLVPGWLIHFFIGAVVGGLAFAVVDSKLPYRHWVNGVLFASAGWLSMMLLFMPVAGAGFFGTAVGAMTPVVTLVMHWVYGVILGTVYGVVGSLRIERTPAERLYRANS